MSTGQVPDVALSGERPLWRTIPETVAGTRVGAMLITPPAVASRQNFAIASGLLYITGGILWLIASALRPPSLQNSHTLLGVSIACVFLGVLVVSRGRALGISAYHGMVALGSVVISYAVYLTGGGVLTMELASLYVFVAVGCFFCFSWLTATMHLIVLEACSTLAFTAAGMAESEVMIQQGSVIAVGIVVGWLTRAASAAERDSLTGLANRRGFDRFLGDGIETAQRTGQTLSVVLLDFDHFKEINSRGGHSAGDQILRHAASLWRKELPAGALLARPGGDEFALVLPGHTANDATALANRLRGLLDADATCSAGVAQLAEEDSRARLLSRADVALYESKSRGGNETSQYGMADETEASREIQDALQDGQFEVYYQPIIDLQMGRVIGDEALIRWNHPQRGLVPPDEFIAMAERSGAIHALGRWILAAACAETARFNRVNGHTRRVSVNASGPELKRPDYAASVRQVLSDTGLDPASLVIEVTESTFDADHPHVIAVLQELRGMGVDIAIDDFGTGYSSLNRLDHLPANVLKIDRSFVAAIPLSSADVPVLKAIVALADALHLRIIAEGVETSHQAEVLAGLGCSHAQGYFFGRPHPEQQAAPCDLERTPPDEGVRGQRGLPAEASVQQNDGVEVVVYEVVA